MPNPGLIDHLTQGFSRALNRWGVWVVYTRSDPRFLCQSCYDLDTHEAPAECDACFGTGYRVTLEKWCVIYSNSLIRAGAYTPLARIGWTTEHVPYIFSRAGLIPRRGDRFFITEWDRGPDLIAMRQARPVRIYESLRVKFIEPNVAGKPVLNTMYCEFTEEGNPQYESVLLGKPIPVTRPPLDTP